MEQVIWLADSTPEISDIVASKMVQLRNGVNIYYNTNKKNSVIHCLSRTFCYCYKRPNRFELHYVIKCGCHAFNDDDVAADLPLQLTLRVDWRSRIGCAPSYDPPPNGNVVCCRTSDDWQRRPWHPLCRRELRLEGLLNVVSERCYSSRTNVICHNSLTHGPLIT